MKTLPRVRRRRGGEKKPLWGLFVFLGSFFKREGTKNLLYSENANGQFIARAAECRVLSEGAKKARRRRKPKFRAAFLKLPPHPSIQPYLLSNFESGSNQSSCLQPLQVSLHQSETHSKTHHFYLLKRGLPHKRCQQFVPLCIFLSNVFRVSD